MESWKLTRYHIMVSLFKSPMVKYCDMIVSDRCLMSSLILVDQSKFRCDSVCLINHLMMRK